MDELTIEGRIKRLMGWIADIYNQKYATATEAQRAMDIETVIADRKELADRLDSVLKLTAEQAEDEGLWFKSAHITEEHLQLALRVLHATIEGDKLMVNILEVQPKTEGGET